jgi:tetratricopeptide (TPR) repeat protein
MFVERWVVYYPSHPDLIEDYGVCFSNLAKHERVRVWLTRALILGKSPQVIGLNLAIAMAKTGRFADARHVLQLVLAAQRDNERAYRHLGVINLALGNLSEAIRSFTKSVIVCPTTSRGYMDIAQTYLFSGVFDAGWSIHERRWRQLLTDGTHQGCLEFSSPSRRFSADRYGLDRVLVWGEQGVGDEVMFGSMLGEFRGWCGKLLVQMDKRLIPLFRRSLPEDVEFYERGSVVSEGLYDSHIPIGSLGLHLRPSRESFEGHRGAYLKADPDRVRALRESLGLAEGERLIGVSWRSSNPETGAGRSLPLWELAQVLGGEGRRLVNLQYGSVQEEIAEAQVRCGICVEQVPGLDCQNDLDGLAALIMACDQVVSIGNATAHLAGALGQKTTVLLPYSPSWRWMAKGEESTWYSSAQLCRQPEPEEWRSLLVNLTA